MPCLIRKHMETCNLILMKDGEGGGIAVGPSAESKVRVVAWRIVVQSHHRIILFEKLSKVVAPNP